MYRKIVTGLRGGSLAIPGALVLALCALARPQGAQSAARQDPPRQLAFEVSDFRDAQGKDWIHLSGEFECDYAEKMDAVLAILWDFPEAPRVFSRIEAVRVRSSSTTRAVTEQRSAVRLLGFAFISDLVFDNVLAKRGEGEASVSFELLESDGSCLSTSGNWELRDLSGPAGPRTNAKFTLDSYIQPRFPGQTAIMRGFGAEDMRKTMRELGEAIERS